jgi:hypothetical protein
MGAPYSDWIWKVSHRKAPGAISAMAFEVKPVKPRVALEVAGCDAPAGGVGPLLIFFC